MEVEMDHTLSEKNELAKGLDRILTDLVFDLVAGYPVQPDYKYEDQLEYYRRHILEDRMSYDELNAYAKKHKRASKIMYPAMPAQIKNQTLLLRMFAGYVVLHNIYFSKSYEEAMEEESFKKRCNEGVSLDSQSKLIFDKEIGYLYSQYTAELTAEDFNAYGSIMYMFISDFERIYQVVADCSLGYKAAISKNSFLNLCDRLGIKEEEQDLFRLQMDVLAEVQLSASDYVDYFDSLRQGWAEKFPQYPFCEEVKAYISDYKKPFLQAFGNQFSMIRKEIQLFEMLASVNVKIALANGARNASEADRGIRKQTYGLAYNLRPYFVENKKNIMAYYHLDKISDSEFDPEFNEVMIPYKKDLLYLNELIMEEINYRNQGNAVSREVRKMRKNEKDLSEYELLLSQKEAQIHDLKKDLEYYETLEAQNFKTEVSQYNRAITDLFQKLCDVRYGSVINELYLISSGKAEASQEEVKGLLQNMIFVFNSMGISPYEVNKIGKNVKFYDDEANIIYAVDENRVVEGLNVGKVRYPGWRLKDSELTLPRVEIADEGEKDEK